MVFEAEEFSTRDGYVMEKVKRSVYPSNIRTRRCFACGGHRQQGLENMYFRNGFKRDLAYSTCGLL